MKIFTVMIVSAMLLVTAGPGAHVATARQEGAIFVEVTDEVGIDFKHEPCDERLKQ